MNYCEIKLMIKDVLSVIGGIFLVLFIFYLIGTVGIVELYGDPSSTWTISEKIGNGFMLTFIGSFLGGIAWFILKGLYDGSKEVFYGWKESVRIRCTIKGRKK